MEKQPYPKPSGVYHGSEVPLRQMLTDAVKEAPRRPANLRALRLAKDAAGLLLPTHDPGKNVRP